MRQSTKWIIATIAVLFSYDASANKNLSICVEVISRDEISPGSADDDQPSRAQAARNKQPSSAPALLSPDVGDATKREIANAVLAMRRGAQRQVSARQAHKRLPPSRYLPIGLTPQRYLKRLFEYFVTHEPGYSAVKTGCQERIRVELYRLGQGGWTAFARYSAHGREERVDRLMEDELSQFAERAVLALLGDQPIASTVKRDTVLRADSTKVDRTISGTNHFLISLGTQLRGGRLPSVQDDGSTDASLRLFSPMLLSLAYRGRFSNWGVNVGGQFGISAAKTALQRNAQGGHVDLAGTFGTGLHFLLYTNPRGVMSFYFGGGATFELVWFSAIKAEQQRASGTRSTLLTGGLDVDLLVGYEFMRASGVQFILQGELNLPAYASSSEDSHGKVSTWFPGATVRVGVMF